MSDIALPAEGVSPVELTADARRARMLGVLYLALAAVVFFVFGLDSDGDATFRLTQRGDRYHDSFPDLTFDPALIAYLAAIALCITAGVQLSRGFGTRTNAVLAMVSAVFVFTFLGWAASGAAFSFVQMMQATVVAAVPLTLGGLAGVIGERVGIINIGIEGMLLMGAFVAAIVGSITSSWIGILAAMASGTLLAWVLAVLAIKYRVDQIIIGVTINIFALGITSFLASRVMSENQNLNDASIIGDWDIPLLADIPFLGRVLFQHNVFVYLMFILVIAVSWLLFKTAWGLRTRAVGEHPMAADTLGVDVHKMRYRNMMLAGAIAGLGGAYFTVGSVGNFNENMTDGRGFIALAAVIFGKWRPAGVLMAALVFGFAESLEGKLALLQTGIPSEFLQMTPFLVTIIVVAGFIGRSRPPAAGGQPYGDEQ